MPLHEFDFRDYQVPIVDAIEKHGYKRLIPILPRRAGKDMVALRIAYRQAVKKTCTIYYIFPTFNQARTSIWDGISIGGIRILDYIPDEICKKNASEMKITFTHNGSVIQFLGSDRYDRLRGTNPYGIVFSEYAFQNPKVFEVASPILAANDGWALFISTPYGKNHFYDLYQEALKEPERWYTLKLTSDDTKHIKKKALDEERSRLSEEMFLQEYFTSFDCGIAGSIFGSEMKTMKELGRITEILYDPSYPVNTAWDIGYNDPTSIIFFQVIGNRINIIDAYENNLKGADHYVKILQSKPYVYGKHIVPHDIKVHEWGTGLTRVEQLSNFGIDITKSIDASKLDGIESVRVTLRRVYIDENNCVDLVRSLNHYHYKWDVIRNRFRDKEPFHDWSSNFCDAMRYMSVSMQLLQEDYTVEDIEEMRSTSYTIGPRAYGNR